MADIVTVPLPHLEADPAVGAEGIVLIVAIQIDRVAEIQPVAVVFAST